MYREPGRLDETPPHPGEVLREDILPQLDMSRRKLARHLRISERCLADLLDEKLALTPDLGSRLGIALGQGARYWIGLQAQYDLWLVSQWEPADIRPLVWQKRQKRDSGRALRKRAA